MFKLTIKTPVFIINFEHISHLVLRFLLLTLNMQLPAVTGNTVSSIFAIFWPVTLSQWVSGPESLTSYGTN